MSTRRPEGILLDRRVLVKEGFEELEEKGYGERKEEGLLLSLYEALYLLEKEKIRVKGYDVHTFIDACEQRIPGFFQKYAVYKDLRDRGYVVRTGFKFGTHFRVYPRGRKPGEAHTKYVIQVIPEEELLEPNELSRMVRLARAIKTELVLAIVDAENEPVYYKVERVNF